MALMSSAKVSILIEKNKYFDVKLTICVTFLVIRGLLGIWGRLDYRL